MQKWESDDGDLGYSRTDSSASLPQLFVLPAMRAHADFAFAGIVKAGSVKLEETSMAYLISMQITTIRKAIQRKYQGLPFRKDQKHRDLIPRIWILCRMLEGRATRIRLLLMR